MRKTYFCFLLLLLNPLNLLAQERNLTYFVDLALQNSPLLKDYHNRINAVRIDSLRLRAGLGLQVNAISNDSYAPVFGGIGQDEAITNGANIYAGLSLSKEVVSRGNLQNQLQSLQLQKTALLNPVKITEQELKRSVTDQYLNVYGLWQQFKFNAAVLELLQKEEVLLHKLTSSGVYKQTDYLTFVVMLQQQELQMIQIKNQCGNAYRNLHLLCGAIDTSSAPLADPNLVLEQLPQFNNSIFYQQFVTDSLNLTIADKQIDFAYQPKLNLFGDVGYNTSLVYQPWRNFGPNIGINLSIPVYDGRQKKMQHDQIALSELTRRNYREFTGKQYQQQIVQLLMQLKDNQKLKNRIDKQVAYAQALVEADYKLFETGEVSITSYLMAISSLLSTKNLLIQNQIENYQLINQINYWSRAK